MIHCHILQHMVMGMQTVWVMGNETQILTVPVEHVLGYLEYGGSVVSSFLHPILYDRETDTDMPEWK